MDNVLLGPILNIWSKPVIVRTTIWSAGPGCHGGCGVLAHIEAAGVSAEGGKQQTQAVRDETAAAQAEAAAADPRHRMNVPRDFAGTRLSIRDVAEGEPADRDFAFDGAAEPSGRLRIRKVIP